MRPHVNSRLTACCGEHSRWLRHVEPARRCSLRNLSTPIVDRDRALPCDRIGVFADPVGDPSVSLAIFAGSDFDPR
jgi:hypothetical protein